MKYLSMFLAVAVAATVVVIAVTVVTITTDTIVKVRGIRAGVKACIGDILNKAKSDNPVIGAKIEAALAVHTKKAVDLLEQSKTLNTLSTEGARELRASFVNILKDAKDDATPQVDQLSPDAQKAIRHRFRSDLAEWKRQCGEVYTIFGIDINLLSSIETTLGLDIDISVGLKNGTYIGGTVVGVGN